MATTMVGQSCTLVKIISSIRHLKLTCIHQPGIAGLIKPLWTGAVIDARIKETEQLSVGVSKPKMPANVFIHFMLKVTDDIKNMNPDITRQDIVRQASKMWRDLDPEEKSRITMERRELFEKYKEELRAYVDNMTPEQIEAEELRKEKKAAKRLKHLKKQLGMPKRPLGAFSLYFSDKYPENSVGDIRANFKEMINGWATLSVAEKEKYRQIAREQSARYKEDIVKWEKEMMALGRFDVIRKALLSKLSKNNQKSKRKVGFSSTEDDCQL